METNSRNANPLSASSGVDRFERATFGTLAPVQVGGRAGMLLMVNPGEQVVQPFFISGNDRSPASFSIAPSAPTGY